MEETSPHHFRQLPPLHAPMLYDHIEVPNLFRIDGDYYLIGSLREDAKIRSFGQGVIALRTSREVLLGTHRLPEGRNDE